MSRCGSRALGAARRCRRALASAVGESLRRRGVPGDVLGNARDTWLGPDDISLMDSSSHLATANTLEQTLEQALAGVPHALVDISHRQCAVEISGPHAERILNGACPLDLDLREFPIGTCTRTMLAKADIVLWPDSDAGVSPRGVALIRELCHRHSRRDRARVLRLGGPIDRQKLEALRHRYSEVGAFSIDDPVLKTAAADVATGEGRRSLPDPWHSDVSRAVRRDRYHGARSRRHRRAYGLGRHKSHRRALRSARGAND